MASRIQARLGRALKLFALLVAGAIALGVTLLFLGLRHFEAELPSLAKIRKGYDPPQVTRVLARDGSVLASLFSERRTVVKFADVPNHVKLAFLAAEDAGFYQHEGLDYFGMLRALVANLRAGRTRQGASTITQQVIKNVVLAPERTYERKIKETILARRLEHELSKDEIFSLYLNQIYLGHGRYGVEEASRFYFGKKVRELDVAEAALLAGLIASPERYSPRRDASLALSRRHYVLGQMLEKGFVTREVYDDAEARGLRLPPVSDGESELAPEVVELVKKLLSKVAGPAAERGGFVVSTTIDPTLQAAARRALRDDLDLYLSRQKLEPPLVKEERKAWGEAFSGRPQQNRVYVGRVSALDDRARTIDLEVGVARGRIELSHEERYNPKRLPPSEFTKLGAALRVRVLAEPAEPSGLCQLKLEIGPEGALVAIDPRTREVLALVGSYEAVAGGLDRATGSRRQPGSAFKGLLYAYALHSRRFTAGSVLHLTRDPKDFRHKPPAGVPADAHEYTLTLRAALAVSDNGAAQQVLSEVGAANVVEWARALGIESKMMPTPSLALGAYEVTPFELTSAYVTFAAGGEYRTPSLIRHISDSSGRDLVLPPEPPRRQVLAPEEAYLTTSLLSSVVTHGTAMRALALKRPLAGKTGTTNQAKDAWFVGYSTDIVAGVWVGFDETLPLGPAESGAVSALPAWIDFMRAAHMGRPAVEFARPSGVLVVRIDPASGLLALPEQEGAIDEEYLDGTAPTEVTVVDAGSASSDSPGEITQPLPATTAAAGDDEAAAASAPSPARRPGEPSDAPAPTGTLPGIPPPF